MAFDFPNAPTSGQVYQGYVWDGVAWQVQGATSALGLVRYDTAQSLTVSQQAQARANIDVTQKNYIINGAMMVSQENGATAGTVVNYYPVDCFSIAFANTTGAYSIAAVGGTPTPGGSTTRIRTTVTTADAALGATDYVYIQQVIEGVRVYDLKSGRADAKTITIQFGVKAPAGTYCIALWNGAVNRSYIGEYVIAAGEANTDVVKSVVVQLDTAGTWVGDNNAGLYVIWTLMAGSSKQQAAGAWTANVAMLGSANQFNFFGTNGNVFELFDVSLTEGSVAPPFVVPDYASELQACQRYYQILDKGQITGGAVATSVIFFNVPFIVKMRSAPTLAGPGGNSVVYLSAQNTETASNSGPALNTASVGGVEFQIPGFGGLTNGQVCFWRRTDTGTKITVSARL